MSKKLAIIGHSTRGEEVIELLEMLGGNVDKKILSAANIGDILNPRVYFFDPDSSDNRIVWYYLLGLEADGRASEMMIFTLEEFLEKYPFKVGDKVVYTKFGDNCNDYPVTIESMEWTGTTIEYTFDGCVTCLAKDLKMWNGEPDTVISGIYINSYDYADEVELNLGNYEIEVRNGKTYAVFKNQETKISKPIFKVGDKIKHKDTVLTIINVKTNSYIVEDEPYNFGILMFSQQDKWELINEPKFKVGDVIVNNYRKRLNGDIRSWKIYQITNDKYIFTDGSFIYIQDQNNWVLSTSKFDIATLKPFKSKVLVRNYDSDYWKPATFGFAGKDKNAPFCVEGGNFFNKCIPYEGNEHLLDTTDDCDDYYKL